MYSGLVLSTILCLYIIYINFNFLFAPIIIYSIICNLLSLFYNNFIALQFVCYIVLSVKIKNINNYNTFHAYINIYIHCTCICT